MYSLSKDANCKKKKNNSTLGVHCEHPVTAMQLFVLQKPNEKKKKSRISNNQPNQFSWFKR